MWNDYIKAPKLNSSCPASLKKKISIPIPSLFLLQHLSAVREEAVKISQYGTKFHLTDNHSVSLSICAKSLGGGYVVGFTFSLSEESYQQISIKSLSSIHLPQFEVDAALVHYSKMRALES